MRALFLFTGFVALSVMDGLILAFARLTPGESTLVAFLAFLACFFIVQSSKVIFNTYEN